MTIGLTENIIKEIIIFLREIKYGSETMEPYEGCSKTAMLSALKNPFQRPVILDKEKDFIDKASRVYYLLIANHPLVNGNKRVATQALLVMAFFNGYRIDTTDIELYAFPKIVMYLNKYLTDKEDVIYEISQFIGNSLKKREKQLTSEEVDILLDHFNKFLIGGED